MDFLDKDVKIFTLNLITVDHKQYHAFVCEALKDKTDAFVHTGGGTYLVLTHDSFKEIFDAIYKHKDKPKELLFMLSDQTNNISDDTFKAVLNQDYLKISKDLANILKHFKKETPQEDVIDSKVSQEIIDSLLDQISEKGFDSLQEKEKVMLVIHSQRVKVKNLNQQ